MATTLTTRAVNRPLTRWMLNHPAVRRYYGSKGHHNEVKHAEGYGKDAHHDHHDHHDPRHFEGPGEGMPFPTYPSHPITVGFTFWTYIFAPMGAGVICLIRAKYVRRALQVFSLLTQRTRNAK